jgi:hypothetical protein
MSATATERSILDAFHHVSRDPWGDVLTFLESLRPVDEPDQEAANHPWTAADLLESGSVGLWMDRRGIGESGKFARRLREQAQNRSRQ